MALCSCGVCLVGWLFYFYFYLFIYFFVFIIIIIIFFFILFYLFYFNKRNVHVWPELSVHKSV